MDTFGSLFRKWHPKVFISDRFYKGFHKAFSNLVKCWFPQGFIRFFDCAKSHSFLQINLMLFDTLWLLLRKWHPKVFINDMFYKDLRKPFSVLAKGCFPQGFIRFSDCAKSHSFLLINPMLFWYFPVTFAEMSPKSLHKRHVL